MNSTTFAYTSSFLVLLVALFMFSAQQAFAAPGGVTSNLQLWLHSQSGLASTSVQGSVVEQWNDLSGNNRHVYDAGTGNEPTFNIATSVNAFNFHPTVQFARASSQYMETMSTTTLSSDSPYTQFVVYKLAATSSAHNIVGAGELAGTHSILVSSAEDRPKVYHNSSQLSGTSNVTGLRPGMAALRYAGGGGAALIGTNGIYRTVGSVATYVGGTTIEIGNYRAGANSLNGALAEVAIYNRALSDLELAKVQTTLALKYGITLGAARDYIASNGTYVFASTTNAGYKSGVFGIGKDNGADLDQRISQSVATTSILMLATTLDFRSPNASGARTSLDDGDFLVLGHNAAPTTFGGVYDGESATRMSRVWKVQETGTVGSVYIAIPNTTTFPTGDPQVIVSSDSTFNHFDTVVDLTDDGTYFYAQINPDDGDYISFAAVDTSVDCTNYDNALRSACATHVYQSQYDTDLATGNWLSSSNDAGTATYTAHNATELATYASSLVAGDILELANGTWSEAIDIEFTVNGATSSPITIRAQDPGGVTFTNAVQMYFVGDHVRVEGFQFNGTYTHPDPGTSIFNLRLGRTGARCDYCLIDNVRFLDYNASDTTERVFHAGSYGQWNKISSSTFSGKEDDGVEIILGENQVADPRDYLLIENNYFADRNDTGSNGYEGIRMGDSTISFTESRSYVIGNLFEDYTGEVELVSLKKNNIVVRGNTFINSGHMPTVMRTSEDSVFEANIVDGEGIGELGGLRINGSDHAIVHNVFQYLEHSSNISTFSPLTLYKGQNTGGPADYRPIIDLLYGFNTLYGSENALYSASTPSGLTIPVWPTGVDYIYNVIEATSSAAALTVDASSTISFAHNVYDGSNLGISDTSGFDLSTDPQVNNHDGVYYSDVAAFDFTRKPYRAFYGEAGISTTTLFKLQYVNSDPEEVITLTRLTASDAGAHYDSDGPVITSISSNGIEETSVTITWTTDEPATSQVNYGLTSSYTSSTTLDSTLATSHSVTITGLTANTEYHFRVRSKDSLNNLSLSSNQTFTTDGRSGGGGSSGGNKKKTTTDTTATPDSGTPTTPSTLPAGVTTGLKLVSQLGPKSIGEQVTVLQKMLARDARIYPEGDITGFYGVLTQKAVERFQVQYNVITSGTPATTGFGSVGPKTLAKLNEVFGTTAVVTAPVTPASADPVVQAKIAQLLSLVAKLQALLAQLKATQ